MQHLKKSLIAATFALATSFAAQAADPIKIGLVLPMTGPFAAYGKQIEHGVKLYLSTHGDSFAGRKVELIVKDDSPGTAGDVSKRPRRNWWSRTRWTSSPASA
jgi:branched-chain amino acid transport system substrate-binding protein